MNFAPSFIFHHVFVALKFFAFPLAHTPNSLNVSPITFSNLFAVSPLSISISLPPTLATAYPGTTTPDTFLLPNTHREPEIRPFNKPSRTLVDFSSNRVKFTFSLFSKISLPKQNTSSSASPFTPCSSFIAAQKTIFSQQLDKCSLTNFTTALHTLASSLSGTITLIAKHESTIAFARASINWTKLTGEEEQSSSSSSSSTFFTKIARSNALISSSSSSCTASSHWSSSPSLSPFPIKLPPSSAVNFKSKSLFWSWFPPKFPPVVRDFNARTPAPATSQMPIASA
mmetsp:Transcript_13/g.36  ORF Transcript_13/g.36 Transcript_13/m.36 type:complete len:285 (+) Transcript_13:1414-2268(+)